MDLPSSARDNALLAALFEAAYCRLLPDLEATTLRVGREGMVGISLFLGVQKLDNQADVQIGGTAFRLPAPALLAEFRRASALQHLLLRYVFALITQASQLGVCNHYHSVEQRLCRFLLRAFEHVGGEQTDLTQGRIARLLGVRRVSITIARAFAAVTA
jgi:hypothetical protein